MTDTGSYYPPRITRFGQDYLATGADIDRLLDSDLSFHWLLVLETYRERRWLHHRLSQADTGSTKAAELTAELAELAEVSALHALRATRQLLDGLLDQRRRLMIDARDEGASWADIGAALDVSRQAAHELYHRQIKNPWTATRVRKP